MMASKRDEFPAKRAYAVRLMERIVEESNAQRLRQCEASNPKQASRYSSTCEPLAISSHDIPPSLALRVPVHPNGSPARPRFLLPLAPRECSMPRVLVYHAASRALARANSCSPARRRLGGNEKRGLNLWSGRMGKVHSAVRPRRSPELGVKWSIRRTGRKTE